MKSTVIIALVGGAIASPVAFKSDALAKVGHRLSGDTGHQVEVETISAGGFTYDMPTTWGRVGGSTASADPDAAGTLLAAVCPAGDTGTACKDGVQVSFIGYRGGEGHRLPLTSSIAKTFDAEFQGKLPGFRPVAANPKSAADGTPWLRYEFTYKGKAGLHREVLGAFRHGDGSGVVVVAAGPDATFAKHQKAIDAFLLGGVEDAEDPEAATAE